MDMIWLVGGFPDFEQEIVKQSSWEPSPTCVGTKTLGPVEGAGPGASGSVALSSGFCTGGVKAELCSPGWPPTHGDLLCCPGLHLVLVLMLQLGLLWGCESLSLSLPASLLLSAGC